MANTKSAKKKIRVDKRRTAVNWMRKKKVRSIIKQFKELILENKIQEAEEIFPKVMKSIDIAIKNRIISKSKGNRTKSKFSKNLHEKMQS